MLTTVEACQYLRLDEAHDSPESAKRSLRFIRRTGGLPDAGRICGQVMFRKAAIDEWLARREKAIGANGDVSA
ncbi:MAG: helix-turn-helix domain-containing protein [Phycisphaerae bacterium]